MKGEKHPAPARSTVGLSAIILGICFSCAGANHFLNPEFYLPMMPSYLPWPRGLILLSGACEILLGLMCMKKQLHRLARPGLILLLLAVFPANIEMALHPERFPSMQPSLLWLRLPLQAVLMLWVFVSLRPSSSTQSGSEQVQAHALGGIPVQSE